VSSQPAKFFVEDASADYHQVGCVTLSFLSNSLSDVAYGNAQRPLQSCLLLQALDRLVSLCHSHENLFHGTCCLGSA
jgi:hypothetical protein